MGAFNKFVRALLNRICSVLLFREGPCLFALSCSPPLLLRSVLPQCREGFKCAFLIENFTALASYASESPSPKVSRKPQIPTGEQGEQGTCSSRAALILASASLEQTTARMPSYFETGPKLGQCSMHIKGCK